MARFSYLIEWDQLATLAARILEALQALGFVQFETLQTYPAGRAWRLWLPSLGDLGRWDCFKSGAGRSVILIGPLPLAPGLDRERSAARAAHLEALEAAFFHLLDQEPTEPETLEAEPEARPNWREVIPQDDDRRRWLELRERFTVQEIARRKDVYKAPRTIYNEISQLRREYPGLIAPDGRKVRAKRTG